MIHVIITTANIPQAYEQRKLQYITSIEKCLQYKHLFDTCTVLECTSFKEEYLEPYHTVYSKEGNPYHDKGLNEINHLNAFLKRSSFSDDDIIVKLSGRYIIEDSYFFSAVHNMMERYDALFKEDSDVYAGKGYHTFFYAIKKRLFLDIADSITVFDGTDSCIEWQIKDLLQSRGNHHLMDRLELTAYQGTYSENVFRC